LQMRRAILEAFGRWSVVRLSKTEGLTSDFKMEQLTIMESSKFVLKVQLMSDMGDKSIRLKKFSGKVGLVTGAGQGIGRAVALRLALEGAVVGVLDWNSDTAYETVEIINTGGGCGIALHADVRNSEQVRKCVDALMSQNGKIDLLVNNAGFDRPGGFLKLNDQNFAEVFGVHVVGAVNCCHACIPIMIGQKDGRIVNVSSVYGKVGAKGESAYSCIKAGLVGFTKSIAREFGPKGIRINAIMPGLTATPTIRDLMDQRYKDAFVKDTPLGRIADPDEIAAPISFLLSDDASFITGAVLEVTGGWGM
ncbi:MAG: SDR family NAD(P)-dependent oxidoreductase, partial [Desulfomonilaceae bacterium]